MYKVYSDSYLKSMKKEEIIDLLRCAEHNWQAAEERAGILSFEYEHFMRGLVKDGILNNAQINKRMMEAQDAYEEEHD